MCDLIDPIGLSQPTVSHHFKVLAKAGFLTCSKHGTWAFPARSGRPAAGLRADPERLRSEADRGVLRVGGCGDDLPACGDV